MNGPDVPLPAPAGVGLRTVRDVVSRLPRGRGRAARLLARLLRRPFVDRVAPQDLNVRLVIDPADPFQLEIWLGAYQPHVLHFLRRCVRPGDRVLCAGLHVGYVVSLARRLAGPRGLVLSAEPDPVARAWAERNLRLADDDAMAPVRILPGGLSKDAGEMRLFESSVMGHSSFAAPHHASSEISVPVRRADDWLASEGVRSLDVMVLDVEGWEVNVLEGMRETIDRSPRLRALVEVSEWALRDAGTAPERLFGLWQERGFTVRWAEEYGARLEHGVWGRPVGATARPPAGDVLCVREGRA